MELQVFVNGKPRDVCGVDNNTTAEEVVNVLCQSLHLAGSYCLVAYWQKNEIVFAPSESPLNLIRRVGDHVKQFQFVLRRTDVRQPVNPSRTRSPVPTSHHHRRASDQPRDGHYRRSEDKEVAAAFANRNYEQEEAELQRLSSIDWSRHYEKEYQRYLALIDTRSRLQLSRQHLDVDLHDVRRRVQGLESEMAGELTNLLNLVEKALEVRRRMVDELTSSAENSLLPPPPPPPKHSSNGGTANAAPICDEVLI